MIRSVFDIGRKYRSADVFLVGSGKSLDYYPPDFFRGRIVVGINLACRRVPCLYSVTVHHEFFPALLKEQTIVVASRYKHGLEAQGSDDLSLLLDDAKTHYVFDHTENGFGTLPPAEPRKFTLAATGTVPALEFCRHIGAKTVFLCGIDGKEIAGETNFSDYGDIAVPLAGGYAQHLDQTRHLYRDLIAQWGDNGPRVVGVNPFLDFYSIP